MKVAITTTGPKLDDLIGAQPDTCSHWLFVDPVTMECEAIPNPLTSVRGPAAGNFLAQILEEYRVKFILTGGCGCKQLKGLSENGMRVLLGMTGSARETVEKFNQNPFFESCDSY